MASESVVRENSAGLCSLRATDRKRSAEALKDFLTRNAVPSMLTENTLNKKGHTWNDLFEDINSYILKETEKYETAKTFITVSVPLSTSLLHLCVSGANKGKAYIKCDRITDACLFILKDKRLTTAIGDAYLSLLYKHVLPQEHYYGFILPATWEDLFHVCISACLSKNSKLDDFTRLRLLFLVIKNATNSCQFIIPLRDALPKLRKCFHKVIEDKKVQEIVMEIMHLVVERLAAENQLAMCDFSETYLLSILKYYDQNMDQKKKNLLFRLSNLSLDLHHPMGRTRYEEGSLASDWSIWYKCLKNMVEIVCIEAVHQQKSRYQQDNTKLSAHFSYLAAAAYYQTFNIPVNTDNDESGNSTKRIRLSMNKNKSFVDIIQELRLNHVPWLGIISMYVKNYGHSISTAEYTSLIDIVEVLVSNNNAHVNWNVLEELACLVISNLANTGNVIVDKVISLWNSCVRNSTLLSPAHKSVHTILQSLLELDLLQYQSVQPLIKLYFEKGMPVTNDSVKTLNYLYRKFFNKCTQYNCRIQCLNWLMNGKLTDINTDVIREVFLRQVANENFTQVSKDMTPALELRDVLFHSFEKGILYTNFELEIPVPTEKQMSIPQIEIDKSIDKQIQDFFCDKLGKCNENMSKTELLLESYNFVNIVLSYYDSLLCHKVINTNALNRLPTYAQLQTALKQMFISLRKYLRNDTLIHEQIPLIKCVSKLLETNYHKMLSTELRGNVDADFFHCINNILHADIKENDENYYEDDLEVNPNALRHNSMTLLAAYCRHEVSYREELLDLILDSKSYNFATNWDIECALRCIEILNDEHVEKPPLDMIFSLMQYMCRDLFRNVDASYGILKMLLPMLDKILLDEDMKKNCMIMVKTYLQRCNKLFYPPHVAAIVHECASKIIVLQNGEDTDENEFFKESLIRKITGNVHSTRIHCCYLYKQVIPHLSEIDVVIMEEELLKIFVIDVPERDELIIKDESANRTLSLLHNYFSLAQALKPRVHSIVTTILLVQKEKNLDKKLVKIVLNKITNTINNIDIDVYLNDNVLQIVNFWFTKKYLLDDLPLFLFGFEDVNQFLEKHLRWAIPAEVLWRKLGSINDSPVFRHVAETASKSEKELVEICFCNIVTLCMPAVVITKYNLYTQNKAENIQQATKLFQSIRQVLGGERWSHLFVVNMGKLMLFTASHLYDPDEAMLMFDVKLPSKVPDFYYPKIVYTNIVNYFGELINENILKHLCESQPLIILQILFKLWESVVKEHIFEYRVLALHTYIIFVQNFPLGSPLDTFLCNFVCTELGFAIKKAQDINTLKVLLKGLNNVLNKLLPEKSSLMQKSLMKLVSILNMTKGLEFAAECEAQLKAIVDDISDYFKNDADVTDFINSSSQPFDSNGPCSNKIQFAERLKSLRLLLDTPSCEILKNLQKFLKINKPYVDMLNSELDPKGFSDDCDSSLVHQVIQALNNILKDSSDEKIIVEACNCLAQIGNYDLKTLVTVRPADCSKVIDWNPDMYFTLVTVETLAELVFAEDPQVTSRVAKCLSKIFKYKESHLLNQVDNGILKPFISTVGKASWKFKITADMLRSCSDGDYWIPKTKESHCQWLTRIVCSFMHVYTSTDNYMQSLREVCLLKPEVCQKILSPLIGLIIYSGLTTNVLTEQINAFFAYIWGKTFTEFGSNEQSSQHSNMDALDRDHKLIVLDVLDMVNFVRLQRNHYGNVSNRVRESLNYLNLEYNKVAWAAMIADQSLAAIYYAELWTCAQNGYVPPTSPDATTALIGGEDVQKIFRRCFVSIGELDAVDGCGTAHLTSEVEKRNHLINTGQYSDALLLHDIALSCGQVDTELQYGAIRSLYKSGVHHLTLQYIRSLPETEQLNDVKYECLAALGDWSEFVDTSTLEDKYKTTSCNFNSLIKTYRYAFLKNCINFEITNDVEAKLLLPMDKAKLLVSKLCQDLNMENCQSVYNIVGKLHLFADIEDYFSVRCDKMSMRDLISKWQVRQLPAFQDFKHLEALITQRGVILDQAMKTDVECRKEIAALQLEYADLCLSNKRIQIAQRLVAKLKMSDSTEAVAFMESQISWAKGHSDIALSLLRNIVSKPTRDVKLSAISLRQYGVWMAESKCDKGRDIINKYMKKSLVVLKQSDHLETRLKVFYDIARFADSEYKKIVLYINSPVFDNKLKCIENMKDIASTLESTQQQLTEDERKAMVINNKFGELEEADLRNIIEEKETFLRLAMRYYLESLTQSDENNLSVFRVISLWLDNPTLELDNTEGGDFPTLLHSIPSWKFITVLPQLAPRLSNEDTTFAVNLRRIIKRCAIEHPHHTLPILFSLKNSDKDKYILNASTRVGTNKQMALPQEPRVEAADTMIKELAQEKESVAVIVRQMDKLCDATISLANYRSEVNRPKQKIPPAEKLHRLGHLDAIPVPTVTIPIRQDANYTYINTLVSFNDYYEFVGGVNAPKKIQCTSSDGIKRSVLIKGRDDLRQDAVMQQVFNIVNALLEKNPITSRDKLRIRTYKVVPLSRRSGVLEWCEGTMPIGLYLTGTTADGGAHTRYRPQDISPKAAAIKMVNCCKNRQSTTHDKKRVFLEILDNFRPVMHHFFTEHFHNPVTWFERRLAYTKSVATTSMVGYVLGLGDRHVNNILIDKNTAEVVHIDFGIAFDQGRTSRTPETVPFRLTQDIVAGFGPSGVEGIFRRCSEKTMQLLRDNQETLLTILEVLLCDPLWYISTQNQDNQGSLSQRALLSVSDKLRGYAGDGAMATSGLVASLIRHATDPARLAVLYPGWKPFL